MTTRERIFEAGGSEWRAIDAWRTPGDAGLCYMLRADAGGPEGSDREDRRAYLEAGVELADLEPDALERLLESAAPLTVTERRITDSDGALWLVQNTGPVWSDERGEDATGIRLRCLTDDRPDVELRGGHVRDASPVELLESLRRGQASS